MHPHLLPDGPVRVDPIYCLRSDKRADALLAVVLDETVAADFEREYAYKGDRGWVYWDDLPPNAREAAEKLGYSKDVWDSDEDIPLEQKPWEELTLEEQNAATVLGYNEREWNDNRIPRSIHLEQ